MAVSMYQIKRWYLMLTGRSVYHVNQDIGKYFSKSEICGYYNNLTEKVTMQPELLGTERLPEVCTATETVLFPVAIFQYGLGAYDLYLSTQDNRYEQKFMQCAKWALNEQDKQGRWNNFFFYSPHEPYGAMAQGEGSSLLIRAYKHTSDQKYLNAAVSALKYMLMPLEQGGTTKYDAEECYLMEYTFKGMVLNGAIFAWWGLYDYVTLTGDRGEMYEMMQKTLHSIMYVLPQFKSHIWSLYSLDGLIASPFYHNLHIAQMQAMYQLTGEPIFDKYAKLWTKRQNNIINKSFAFIYKSIQKILE